MVHLRKPRNFFSYNLSADKETPFYTDTLHEILSQTFWIDYENDNDYETGHDYPKALHLHCDKVLMFTFHCKQNTVP